MCLIFTTRYEEAESRNICKLKSLGSGTNGSAWSICHPNIVHSMCMAVADK